MKKAFVVFLIGLLINSSVIVFGSEFTDIYDELKSDYPQIINKLTDNGSSASEANVRKFLNAVSSEIEKSGTITKSNFDSKMYNAMLDVLGIDPSEKDYVAYDEYQQLATSMIVNYGSVLATKKLTGDLLDLRNVVMNQLIGQTSVPAGGAPAGGSIATTEELSAEIVYGKTTDANGVAKVTLNQSVLTQLANQTVGKIVQLELKELSLDKGERIDFQGVQDLFKQFNKVSLNLNDIKLTLREDLKTPLSNKVIDISYDGNVLDFDWETATSLKSKSLFEPIAIELPYSQTITDETLTIMKVDNDGSMTPVGSYFDGETVKFYTDEPGRYKVVSNPVRFDDFSLSDYWGARKVERLAASGVVGGRGEGVYDPSATITRGEFATLVTKMLQYDETSPALSFTDVDASVWYAPYVNTAFTFGLMSGRGEGAFDPDGAITQEEILIVLSKVLENRGVEKGAEESASSYTLKTENASSWATNYIETAITNGALSGMPLSTVNMSKSATRLETANMLYEIQEELYK